MRYLVAPEPSDCTPRAADGLIPGDVVLMGDEQTPMPLTVIALAWPCPSALQLRLRHTDPNALLPITTATVLAGTTLHVAPRTRWALRIFSVTPEVGELTILDGLMPSGELLLASLKHPRLLPGHPNLDGCTARLTKVVVDPGATRSGFLREDEQHAPLFINLDYVSGAPTR